MDPKELPTWLQAGGVVAFAAAVWWEQRSIRRTLESVQLMLAAMLGPEKVGRLRRQSGRALTPPPIDFDRDSE